MASGKHSIKKSIGQRVLGPGKTRLLGVGLSPGRFEGGQDADQILVSHRSDPLMKERADSLRGWGVEAAPTVSER